MLRKKPWEERSRCGLTFKIMLEIPLSIAAPESFSDKFIQFVLNNNDDVSKVLRDLLFEELKITNKKELNLFFEKQIIQARENIYNKLNVRRDNPFSRVLTAKITKLMEKNGKK